MKYLLPLCAALLMTACSSTEPSGNSSTGADVQKLQSVADAQSSDHKARYSYRHPVQTLEFFGIEPGMTVVEVLPGGGWYSSILGPYLGPEGTLIGVDYDRDMMKNFDWVTDQFLEERKSWGENWKAKGATWPGGDVAKLEAYTMASIPEQWNGKVDSVLFIRALHNLARFEPNGNYRTKAIKRSYELLKPGGTVGIVQHQVSDDRSSEWADGSRGYLKSEDVIQWMESAGFTYVGQSPVNQNPKDKPGQEDSVWRLPPSLGTSKDNPDLKAKYQAIGESNRMTLLFKK